MLKFSRKTEYALLAIEHMIHKREMQGPESVSSVREISEMYHIPFPLLAKVLQQLAGKGFVKATHGLRGGYLLAKTPQSITLANLVEVFDGPLVVAECFKRTKISCPQWDGCTIKSPFTILNHKLQELLSQTTLADLTAKP